MTFLIQISCNMPPIRTFEVTKGNLNRINRNFYRHMQHHASDLEGFRDRSEDAWMETHNLNDEEIAQWEDQAVFEGYTRAHNVLTELLEDVEDEIDDEPEEEADDDEVGMTI
jgi:hypothetical protein